MKLICDCGIEFILEQNSMGEFTHMCLNTKGFRSFRFEERPGRYSI